ncbi:MAG TPA: formimidoylglutamate deiminase [Gammaproteobacteria bacterium]|nr:formimidoylglutamate deiminase [Gammaproteobacteria bacterium]
MPDPVQLLAPLALLPHGWEENVRIAVDATGAIVGAGATRGVPEGGARRLDGPVIPGMANLHSHAFQRAMAGLTERRSGDAESFWTWRDTMYRFVSLLEPAHIEAIASQLYVEMLEAGYTGVAEFHYLHHQHNGQAYAALTETSQRIVAAAKRTGIRLTHLPVLYTQGGFGGKPLSAEQRRFGNSVEQFGRLMDELHAAYAQDPGVRLGLGLHSLRAVDTESLCRVADHVSTLDNPAPVHIHVAEQMREVEECLAYCGRRPVEYLFDSVGVDERWCLVHATHVNDGEINAMVASRAVAGLCPTTEANLGDGTFPAAEFLQRGGRFGVGSDSHVSVSPTEELRLLEYGQRLAHRRRAVLASGQQPSTGRNLYQSAARGGAQALGIFAGELKAGACADFVVLDAECPALYGRHGDALLDAALFAGDRSVIGSVWVGGREVVSNGAHSMRESIFNRYKSTLDALMRAQ